MVEEVAKSSTTDDQIKKSRVRPGDEEELEEGEIIPVEEGDASSSAAPAAITQHPLEHSSTFWFDNPSAKSRQAAWGSSIRSIYTFSTVEDFWRKVRPKMTPTIIGKHMLLGLLEPATDQSFYFLGIKATTATFAAAMCNILPVITFFMACILRLWN